MSDARKEEIAANLARAENSLKAAGGLAQGGLSDDAASRAYYAAFYAATAALLAEGLEYGKHSGVIAGVHQHLVKTGKLGQEYGKSLNWLYELRGTGDYGAMEHVPTEEAKRAVESAEAFVTAIRSLLSG